MATANEELTQNIRDQFLQCKICLDGLKLPKTLPCLHTFCAECIAYYIEHNRLDSRKFACPICRRHIYIPKNGIEGFPDSFFVESLSDVISQSNSSEKGTTCGICKFKEGNVEAKVLCVECKIELCESCSSAHSSAKVTESHTLLPLNQQLGKVSRENYCRVHRGETIKYYCETCNSPICLPCTFLDHKGHEIEEIKNVRQNFSQDMEGLVLQSQDNILQLSHARDDLVELENELFVRKEVVKTDVRKALQELIRSLQDQESKLVGDVDEFYDTVTLGRDRQKVERTIFRLQRAHDFAKQLLSSETSPIAQIVNRSEAKENLNQALEYELPDVTKHSEKLGKYIYFLPGKHDVGLGSLLKCTGHGAGNAVTELRHTIPSSKGIFLHKLKTGGDAKELEDVVGLGFLPNGDIAVLVSIAKKLKIFNQKGKLRYEFGDDEDLLHPSDLVITRDGEIAVSDCGYMVVKIFDPFGSVRAIFGGEDTFGLPISITIDKISRFLVCDQAKQRITIHRQNGELLDQVQINEIEVPQFISCHGNKVYICDTEHNIVTIYSYGDESLNFIAKLSAPNNGNGEFLDCSGICVDRNGGLLVSDVILDRIHVFNTKGEISSVIASGKSFLRPTCMAVSPDGLLVVAQQGITIDSEIPSMADVCLYRLVRADVF